MDEHYLVDNVGPFYQKAKEKARRKFAYLILFQVVKLFLFFTRPSKLKWVKII